MTPGSVGAPGPTAVDDLALAVRCAGGERAAQRELFRREGGRVHAILYRLLGSNNEMEDLVQEAFLAIFRSLKGFRGEATLGTWIDRITTRVACAYLARKRPAAAPLEAVPEAAADVPSGERWVEAREAARRLYRVLDRLETRQRTAFVLHVLHGRPLREVARIMEASLIATKTRVWRARRVIETYARREPTLAAYVTGTSPGTS